MNGFRNFIMPFVLARVAMKDMPPDVANRTSAVVAMSALNPAASLLVAQEKKNDEQEKQNLKNNFEEGVAFAFHKALDVQGVGEERIKSAVKAGMDAGRINVKILKDITGKRTEYIHLNQVLTNIEKSEGQ